MNEKILVAGGGGFLGSHLCKRLLKEGNEVICLDNFGSGRRENIRELENYESFSIIEQDIRLLTSLPIIDRIYHLASRASPADFTDFPVDIALANTYGTRRLLDHTRACDARMIFASTSEVYGDPEVTPQSETYNGNVNIRGVRGCYDESKRFGETLTVAYQKEYNIDARTVRIFNTYGPHMRPDDGRVIPTFISQALRDADITVFGDGNQTRSFCYVSDLIEGITSVMRADSPQHDVFNLGKQNECTINDLADKIINMTNSQSDIVYEPLPEDDPTHRNPDISRVSEELGWRPKISLHEGLKKTIDYYKSIENL